MDANCTATLTPTLVFGAMSTATCRAASSSTPRHAASNPVAPTSSGTPAEAQARACADTEPPMLKSAATEAPWMPRPGSAVTSTPVGSPRAAASQPSRRLPAEATAPLRRQSGACRAAHSSACPMRPVMPKIARACMRRGLIDGPGEELLDALEESLLAGLMTALIERRLEFLEQFFLLGAQTHRRLDHDPAEQVAGRPAPHRAHAFLAHAKHPPRLGLHGNLQDHLAVERRHLHRAAERRRGKADRHLAGQVVGFAFEDGVFAHPYLDVQVAGRSAVAAGLAFAVQADAVPAIDAGRYGDGQALLLANAALAVAGITGVADDLAPPLAARAGLLNGENRLLHPDLTLPVAGIAGLGSGPLGGAGSLAGLVLGQGGNLDLGVGAEHGLFEIDLEFIAQIGAAKHLRAAALTAGENIAEHLAEDIAERLAGAEPAAAAAL